VMRACQPRLDFIFRVITALVFRRGNLNDGQTSTRKHRRPSLPPSVSR
jgi:hypothetical protein